MHIEKFVGVQHHQPIFGQQLQPLPDTLISGMLRNVAGLQDIGNMGDIARAIQRGQ